MSNTWPGLTPEQAAYAEAIFQTPEIRAAFEKMWRRAKVEALTEFSKELHERASNLNGPRKNEAWFCSDRALNRAAEIEQGTEAAPPRG